MDFVRLFWLPNNEFAVKNEFSNNDSCQKAVEISKKDKEMMFGADY